MVNNYEKCVEKEATSPPGRRKKSKVWNKISKIANIGSELAEVVVHLKGKPTILGSVAIASRLVSSYNRFMVDPEPFDDWILLDVDPLGRKLIQVLDNEKEVIHVNGTAQTCIANLGGHSFGWFEGEDNYFRGFWYEDKGLSHEEARNLIGRAIWERVGTGILIQSTPAGDLVYADPLSDSISSGTATALHVEIDKFLQKGHHRSVLLYGEPGTGKSHIIRQVAKLAGKYYVRFNTRRLPSNLDNILRTLCPDAVLVDDIDRSHDPEGLLETIGSVLSNASLFMATANDIICMDRASLRPGRFDVVREIDKLDEEILTKILSQFPESIREEASLLPIAYISELQKIVEVVGPEAAIESMRDLKKRFDTIKEGKVNDPKRLE